MRARSGQGFTVPCNQPHNNPLCPPSPQAAPPAPPHAIPSATSDDDTIDNGNGDSAGEAGVPGSHPGGLPHLLHCRADCGTRPGHAETLACSGEREGAPALQAADARYYLEKMVLELSAEQAAVIHDALRKARKESGARDRASQFSYLARVFLERGTASTKGNSKKPPYQVVIHHHPGSGVSWTESARGPLYIPPALSERALCDAEVVEPVQGGHEKAQPATGHGRAEDVSMNGQEAGAGMVRAGSRSPQLQSSALGLDEQDSSDTPMAHVNRLYQACRERGRSRKRDAAVTGERDGLSPDAGKRERPGKKDTAGKKHHERTGTIPAALRKTVLLRDGGRCMVPGCGRAQFVEVHHLRPRGVYGAHMLDELVVLCQGCHQAVHEGRLVIERNASGRLIVRRS